jgi:hypothetical protein
MSLTPVKPLVRHSADNHGTMGWKLKRQKAGIRSRRRDIREGILMAFVLCSRVGGGGLGRRSRYRHFRVEGGVGGTHWVWVRCQLVLIRWRWEERNTIPSRRSHFVVKMCPQWSQCVPHRCSWCSWCYNKRTRPIQIQLVPLVS